MPLDSIRVSAVIPASAERAYAAWLDSIEHGKMTGASASVNPRVGGLHSAWDGYIKGTNLELEPGRRIVQSWRSGEFAGEHADSRLEVLFIDVAGGCEITIAHTEIPVGHGSKYEEGWHSHYFVPMTRHFGGVTTKDSTPAAANEPAKKAPSIAVAPKPARKVARKAAKKAVKVAAKPAKKAAKKTAKAAKKKAPKKVAKKAPKKKAAKKATKAAKKKAPKKVAKKAPKKKAAKKVAKKPAKKPARKPGRRR